MSEKERPEEMSVMSTRQAVTVSESSEMSYKITNGENNQIRIGHEPVEDERGRGKRVTVIVIVMKAYLSVKHRLDVDLSGQI